MLKLNFKSNTSTLLDLKVRTMISRFIFKCDTSDQFEATFKEQLAKVEGYGDKFKELYHVTRIEDKALVWRKNNTGEKDRLMFEISELKY